MESDASLCVHWKGLEMDRVAIASIQPSAVEGRG